MIIAFNDKDDKLFGYVGEASPSTKIFGLSGRNSSDVFIGTTTGLATNQVGGAPFNNANTTASSLVIKGKTNLTQNMFSFNFIRFDSSSIGTHNVLMYGKYNGDIVQGIETGKQVILKGDTGNVGIGKTTPTEKLEVVGKIKTSNVIFTGIPTYANDAAAGAGGLVAGEMYKTATGELIIKLRPHKF